jgi:hypothetical protein
MKFVTAKSGGQFVWSMHLIVKSMNPVVASSMG